MLVPRDARHDVAQGNSPEQTSCGVVLNEAGNPTVESAELLLRLFDLGANLVA
jgi:hypothetical protein